MIRVGGATEAEVKERKDRVDDAMHATRAAVEEGILPGGGVAFLRCLKVLENSTSRTTTRRRASASCARRWRPRPGRLPATRARTAPSLSARSSRTPSTPGATTLRPVTYGDLVANGIIDPTKVVRTALQDAASIAGLLVTTEAMVAEKPKKAAPAGAATMDY